MCTIIKKSNLLYQIIFPKRSGNITKLSEKTNQILCVLYFREKNTHKISRKTRNSACLVSVLVREEWLRDPVHRDSEPAAIVSVQQRQRDREIG